MTVTVLVPQTLRAAVDGRAQLELGLPPGAGVGELLDTLLKLYPKLRPMQSNERRPTRTTLNLVLSERALRELAVHGPGLRDGQVVYLSGTVGRQRETSSSPSGKGIA